MHRRESGGVQHHAFAFDGGHDCHRDAHDGHDAHLQPDYLPSLTSMRVFSRFRDVMISSAIVSVICFLTGILLSCYFERMPAGACVVAVNAVVFVIFSAIGLAKRRA